MDKSVNKIDRNFRKTQSNNSYRSPLSPTQCCYNFRLILNVVQQHCVGGRGGGCFRQNTGIKLQFKLSPMQIKILLTSYVHDCTYPPLTNQPAHPPTYPFAYLAT
jgi:hypothetical protein